MRQKLFFTICSVILFVGAGCQSLLERENHGLTIASLRCEYRVDPAGIDVTAPRLSWILQSDRRGQVQTSFQILVASDLQSLKNHDADVWDSGKVPGDETTAIVYDGKPLRTATEYFWKVRIWDENGLSIRLEPTREMVDGIAQTG